MNLLQSLLLLLSEFLRRHGKQIGTVLGTVFTVALVNDRSVSRETLRQANKALDINRRVDMLPDGESQRVLKSKFLRPKADSGK